MVLSRAVMASVDAAISRGFGNMTKSSAEQFSGHGDYVRRPLVCSSIVLTVGPSDTPTTLCSAMLADVLLQDA
jgi:hypothetical protein